MSSHHQRENQWGLGGLDDPERCQGAHLDQSEDVDLEERDVTEVEVVGLVLGWHQHQEQPVDELHPVQGVDAHVHEDAVQDGHGDELEDGGELDREPSEEEHTDASDPLLPDQWELKLKTVEQEEESASVPRREASKNGKEDAQVTMGIGSTCAHFYIRIMKIIAKIFYV